MRQLVLAAGLLGAFLLAPVAVRAQGVLKNETTPVQQSEGRDPIVFTASCTSSGWTLVISSDVIAYSTLIVAVTSNTAGVCLYPTSSSSSSASPSGANQSGCFPYTGGTELPAQNSSLTDYSKAAWWCRSVAGTQNLKGYRTRDRGDYGKISQPGLQ